MRITKGWLSFAVVLASALAPPMSAQEPPKLDSTDFRVGALTADMDTAAIRGVLGAPDSITVYDNPFDAGGKIPVYFYRDLMVTFSYGETPLGFTLTGPSVATARGLKVGDSVERARALYSEPGYTDPDAWEYYDPKDTEGLHVIQLSIRDGHVRQIYVGWLLD
ncbi:MAG TPA: hypothetical protein VJ957_12350 [Longimicrobiales bacterium]|nr:hypothetical protein [Longimicrobiales bacterium]